MKLDLEQPFHMPHIIMDSSLFITTLTCYTGIKSAHTDFQEKSQNYYLGVSGDLQPRQKSFKLFSSEASEVENSRIVLNGDLSRLPSVCVCGRVLF